MPTDSIQLASPSLTVFLLYWAQSAPNQVWDRTANAGAGGYVTYNESNYANYLIGPMIPVGTLGKYWVDRPSGVDVAGFSEAIGVGATPGVIYGRTDPTDERIESKLTSMQSDYQRRGEPVMLPYPAPTGYGVPSDGTIPVNHDTGGADNLRYVHSGSGVANGLIKAYLTSDYDAGIFNEQGSAITRSDGRWTTPMYLSSGLSYTFTFSKVGVYRTSVKVQTI